MYTSRLTLTLAKKVSKRLLVEQRAIQCAHINTLLHNRDLKSQTYRRILQRWINLLLHVECKIHHKLMVKREKENVNISVN